VTTDELLGLIEELYPDHPRLGYVRRVIRSTGVHTRRLTRPPAEQLREGYALLERTRGHLQDSLDLAERAARGSLREAALGPEDVDALIVVSATGHTMPGLDVRLIAQLGLRPTVRRIPVTQMGCCGGVFGISTAMELVAARPDVTVLVVCADVFSHYLHRDDTGMDGMIFKGIIGDGAGACLVRARADGPHLRLIRSWEWLDPHSQDVVGTRTDGDGLHGHNSPRLMGAIRRGMGPLNEWLARTVPEGTDGTPGFVVSHTGSSGVLDRLAEGLGCAPELLAEARASLREVGNLGSASLLDVLHRTFAGPPAEGTHGLLLGVGPGVSLMAMRTVWQGGV
jgi:predicted naringenin-chalcone synthase